MKYYLRTNGFAEHQWIHFVVQENEPSIGNILSGHTPQSTNNEVQVEQNSTTGPQDLFPRRFSAPPIIGRGGPTDRDLREVYPNGVTEPRLVKLNTTELLKRSSKSTTGMLYVLPSEANLQTSRPQTTPENNEQGENEARRRRSNFKVAVLAAKPIMGIITAVIRLAGCYKGFRPLSHSMKLVEEGANMATASQFVLEEPGPQSSSLVKKHSSILKWSAAIGGVVSWVSLHVVFGLAPAESLGWIGILQRVSTLCFNLALQCLEVTPLGDAELQR
ncbi:hypothetical protein CJI97_004352 [Candidozyma auris]|nr:hypothetical protein CJI97_004352 [[Candida] auris]